MEKNRNFKSFFSRTHIWVSAKAALLLCFLLTPQQADAVGPAAAAVAVPIVKEIIDGVVGGVMTLGVLAASVGALTYIAFSVAKFLLWLAATSFNWAMNTMVFGFSEVFGTSDGMLFAWSMLRDIGNIILLFGFVYMGLRMILDVGHYSAQKALPKLVIAAVLINFSLFAAGAIIDTANGIASALNAQTASDDVCLGLGDSVENCRLNHGIAGQVLGQLNVISVVSQTSGVGFQNLDLGRDVATYFSNPVSGTITFVSLAILITLAATVLFAGTLLLLTRGITLAFLLVISPIGLVCMAIEPLHDVSKRYWKSLIDNALFAPTFLILLFVGLSLTDNLKNSIAERMPGSNGLVDAIMNGDGVSAGPIFLFLLVIGFMIAALVIAKSFGVMGANFVMNAATAVTYGTVTRSSNLVGGGSMYALRNAIQSSGLGNSKTAQVLVNRIIRPLEKTNYDMRRLGMGAALAAGGVTSGAKPAEHATFGDMLHIYADAKAGKTGKKLEAEYKGEIAIKSLENAAHHGKLNNEQQTTLASLSAKELAKLHAVQEAVPEVAQAVSPQQFDDLMKLDADKGGLDDMQKDNFREARFLKVTSASTPDEARAALKGMPKSDLEGMPSATLMKPEVLEALTDKQRDDLLGSNKRSASEKNAIRSASPVASFEARYKAAGDPQQGGSAARQSQFLTTTTELDDLRPEQVAKLSTEILKRPETARHLSVSMLIEIEKEKKLSRNDIRQIAQNIRVNGIKEARDHIDPYSPASGYWN